MSAFSDSRRAEVAARAGHRCEYCHLPSRGQVATFPIDHVIPRSRGGSTGTANLALTCPRCNSGKWTAVDFLDPVTGETSRLFHPRQDDWDDHFIWSNETRGELIGRTAIGRATIAVLQINAADMIHLRQLLARLELFPELNA